MSLTCEQLDGMLPDLFDGQLGDTDLDEALAHLTTCDSCRLTVDELRSVGELYRAHRLRLPDDVRARITRALEEDRL